MSDPGLELTHTADPPAAPPGPAWRRCVGIDIGAETVKVVDLAVADGRIEWRRREIREHGKAPGPVLRQMLAALDWSGVAAAAAVGRLSGQLRLPQVPPKQAQARGFRHLHPGREATVVGIGSHGFSVLELRANGVEVFRENSRCSQGTGNFLRQLVERFSLTIEEASELCGPGVQSAPLSGRCPVILKTDMTHLANKGENRAAILAGLFDAVCENVMVLVKPGVSPRQVLLVGGVSRSPRVQQVFRDALARQQMELLPWDPDSATYLEAMGCALESLELAQEPPALEDLLAHSKPHHLERVASLANSLSRVRRMPLPPPADPRGQGRDLILGFDLGSTGSKALALDARTLEQVWTHYRRTLGDPVGAAQDLLRHFCQSPAGAGRVLAIGVTGSGREIAGSLMATCYGRGAVFILNEIAAHATGALHYDPRVDTIFEIGGQDAKYIRLAEGRVVDCAMNEACSAGTGSFIEEQGQKFAGIEHVAQLGAAALEADYGVSLGQHCSVFMAEVIDESVAAGVPSSAIIAGLYDSVVQNYLNRVKGNRSVGHVIFCQGMPFSADALAAAVARQTGAQVIIPPDPGLVGALGITLLTLREVDWKGLNPLNPALFLDAKVEQKNTFICQSAVGCGGSGNRCRIDCLRTHVENERRTFTWGGACSLYDKGTRKRKLPDRAPDPFREREELARALAPVRRDSGSSQGRIALSDEFVLKQLYPFFAVFLQELGFDLVPLHGADHADLKRGIQTANIPFCAPMQLFHGLVERLAETGAERLFLPMLRHLPRSAGEGHAVTCPIVQASPDILKWDLRNVAPERIVSPVVAIGQSGLSSPEFQESCRQLAAQLGISGTRWIEAHARALSVQLTFDRKCLEIGQRALEFCRDRSAVPVVVLGRAYTIYNPVLNSNVPAILREQGAIGIPVDCYPIDAAAPVFPDMYWGYGQQILRAAHQIRRTPGVYSLYCSNYSCGPDSFNLHFYSYIMEGKPFSIIETDGHSGDAGTKTRVEAFLHCVAEDARASAAPPAPRDFHAQQYQPINIRNIQRDRDRETILIPWMGPGSEIAAACLRGAGFSTQCLPPPDSDALRHGRRFTSGKECLPMCLTLGSLLQYLEPRGSSNERYVYLMPSTWGPCRLGVYQLLTRITTERLGWSDRLRFWSPKDTGYFEGFAPGLEMLLFVGIETIDILTQGLFATRPGSADPEAVQSIYRRYCQELYSHVEAQARGDLSLAPALWQIASRRFFGLADLVERAAADLVPLQSGKPRPTVLLVGEIYVRLTPFSNDFVIEKLEARGLSVRLAPLGEWLEYCDVCKRIDGLKTGLGGRISDWVQERVRHHTYHIMGRALGWPERPRVPDMMADTEGYLRSKLRGEAVLTIGGPLHEWRRGDIDAMVSVGPLECMPNKIAEAQLFHVSEREGLPSITLSYNGDPISDDILDNFAYEVQRRFRQKQSAQPAPRHASAPR